MEIFIINSNARNKEEVVHELFSFLLVKGYVKESYETAIHVREQNFPTGLELQGEYNVAIPHAETEHVIKPAIAVGILQTPIFWENMEDPEQKIKIHLVFLLAISEPQMVVPNLKALTDNVFSNPEVVAQLRNTSDLIVSTQILRKLIDIQ
ncbi:PTS sugar transporter subunit IIA [Candidatus Hodarchaeum mangrovi]